MAAKRSGTRLWKGGRVPCTARGEVRSHINYFSPHPVDGLPPTTRVSHTHPHERHRNGLETNPLSLSLFPISLLFLFLPFSLCGFSRISSPYFSLALASSRTLMPYGKSIFRRSPHCRPSRPEGRRSCNVFAMYLISSTHLVITIVSRNRARPLGNTTLFTPRFSSTLYALRVYHREASVFSKHAVFLFFLKYPLSLREHAFRTS